MNDFMFYFLLIQAFIAGWIASRIYYAIKLTNTIRKIAKENGITLEEMGDLNIQLHSIKTNVIKVPNLFTESTNNSIICYNKDSGDFIAQATSVEELAENVYKYNKIKFAYVKHNEDKFWFVEGKIRNDLKEI